MPFITTIIPGAVIFEPRVFEDSRGHFFESYNKRLFSDNGITADFVQDNQSRSLHGVLRGLHFQNEPFAQAKLVRALAGNVLDVIVDIRRGSPAYGKSVSIELSAENKKQLFIPRGCAHGFIVLSDFAEFFYKCDNYYNKDAENGILCTDPKLAIDWCLDPCEFILSEKDMKLPQLKDINQFFTFRDTL